MPPRSLTKATCWPVFGFQVGEVLAPAEKVMRLGRCPEVSVTNSSGVPFMLDMNMSCDPSGDHAGEEFVPRNLGHEIKRFEAVEWTQICALMTLLLPGWA